MTKFLSFALLLGVFVFSWFCIVAAIVGVAYVVAILLTIYEWGGLRALMLTAVIIAAFVALLITLSVRKRGMVPVLISWFNAKPGGERLSLVIMYAFVASILVKGAWNMATDPPGVIRPCTWCSPLQPYKSPPPPEPPPRH
jgi:hypothetical protein